ncbi:YhgE/Pip domain-containing protein [Agromyces aerolatus]|uniref:YhgE/Pip domain-containing protein n=1 Tax=Agromyces sp. LY-1074 TaxID=3074080 RepID=UPI00285EF6FE|nr:MULTISPECIES: YhgE/Pip domain-containing protein [unclassified Agromyces]MDR5699063.1 YhgE/Pip domain-containing protein [Agromyces sp. LY-1074]MDR5705159.1 YhgE/Pip domain-containing protein [Agromyces sp. LY-1358]
MSTRLQSLLGRTTRQRRTRFAVLLAAVMLVPLAVAGLVSAALGGAGDRLETIPAVVVNDDEMVTTTLPDGSEQTVLAGRLLVTELTGDGGAGFDWTITNDEEAAEQLASGEAYAVLTIPSGFSESITSLSGEHPTKADLSIRTDDAHGYLAGAVAQSVGTAMSATFGQAITAQYLEGFYGNLATLGGSLGDAADGATELSSGAGSLADGVGQLSAGVAQAASGATDASAGAATYAGGVHQYADGVTSYTQGVDGIAGGLGQLSTQTESLGQLGSGISQYVGGVNQAVGQVQGAFTGVAAALTQVKEQNPELAPVIDQVLAGLQEQAGPIEAQLQQFSAAGTELANGASGLGGLHDGIAQLAGGAAQLSAGSGGLRDGATGLASGADQLAGGVDELAAGLGQLSTGASAAATGATQLADGTTQLAEGLSSGAEGAEALTGIDAAETADVVSQPVSVASERENEIGSIGEVIGILFAPIGLWIGALAMFLVFRPVTREVLRSTSSTGGIVWRTLARASLVALAQTVAIVALLHTALGVSWSVLPQTLAFSALMALVFTALHAFLTTAFGRAGLLVSLVLVALQIAATGGLYPIEVVSDPFQAISPFLPLTWAVQGMQGIVAGVGGGVVGGAAAVLALFGLAGVLLTWAVMARRRGIRSTGLTAAALG